MADGLPRVGLQLLFGRWLVILSGLHFCEGNLRVLGHSRLVPIKDWSTVLHDHFESLPFLDDGPI